MEIIVFAIPFAVALFLLLFFKRKVTIGEYVLLIVPSILVALIIELCMKSYNTSDVEYFGGYVTKIRHYDRWNEYIHKICTRKVRDGKDSDGNPKYRTEHYDCSYVENHPERWVWYDERNREVHFYNEKEFNTVKEHLGNPDMVFVDMNRNYHTIDGDAQDYYWDNTIKHCKTTTRAHDYENPVKASRSIFKFEDISDSEADSLGLFRYPDIYNLDQCPIMGLKMPKNDEQAVRFLNGYYGGKYQFRLYVLFFKDKPIDITEKQRSYWQGGNKNELVVCLGYSGNRITWCNAFSWEDSPELVVATRAYFNDHKELRLHRYVEYIKPYMKNRWHRKEFKDFQYLSVELSDTQYLWIIILVGIYNVVMSIFVITNEWTNE